MGEISRILSAILSQQGPPPVPVPVPMMPPPAKTPTQSRTVSRASSQAPSWSLDAGPTPTPGSTTTPTPIPSQRAVPEPSLGLTQQDTADSSPNWSPESKAPLIQSRMVVAAQQPAPAPVVHRGRPAAGQIPAAYQDVIDQGVPEVMMAEMAGEDVVAAAKVHVTRARNRKKAQDHRDHLNPLMPARPQQPRRPQPPVVVQSHATTVRFSDPVVTQQSDNIRPTPISVFSSSRESTPERGTPQHYPKYYPASRGAVRRADATAAAAGADLRRAQTVFDSFNRVDSVLGDPSERTLRPMRLKVLSKAAVAAQADEAAEMEAARLRAVRRVQGITPEGTPTQTVVYDHGEQEWDPFRAAPRNRRH